MLTLSTRSMLTSADWLDASWRFGNSVQSPKFVATTMRNLDLKLLRSDDESSQHTTSLASSVFIDLLELRFLWRSTESRLSASKRCTEKCERVHGKGKKAKLGCKCCRESAIVSVRSQWVVMLTLVSFPAAFGWLLVGQLKKVGDIFRWSSYITATSMSAAGKLDPKTLRSECRKEPLFLCCNCCNCCHCLDSSLLYCLQKFNVFHVIYLLWHHRSLKHHMECCEITLFLLFMWVIKHWTQLPLLLMSPKLN